MSRPACIRQALSKRGMDLLRRARGLALLAMAGVLAACSMGGTSEREALAALNWNYDPDGIQLSVQADPSLNQSSNQAHTLVLTIVQAADPNAFITATATSQQLSALLMAEAPPAGMLSLHRLFIAPGSSRTLSLPRAEKAQFVGVAAGYYHLDPARSTRLYRIGVDVETSGLIFKSRTAHPEALQISLQLGANGILGAPSTRAEPPVPQRPVGGLFATDPQLPQP